MYCHGECINCCKFYDDGNQIVSTGTSGILTLWSVRSGTKRLEYHGHKDSIMDCCYNQYSGRLATGCYDKSVGIWQVIPQGPGIPHKPVISNPITDILNRNASVQVNFRAPPANGAAITHYRVQYRLQNQTKYDNEVTIKIASIYYLIYLLLLLL